MGCLVIVIATIVCSSSAFLTVNAVCSAYLPQRLPVYPGAEVVAQTHNFISPFGMGITTMVLYSDDQPDAVRSWYGVTTGTFLRESLQSGDLVTTFGRRVARVDWSVIRAEDGIGTQIILYANCVN